jgi:hypothetical protein
MVIVFGVTDREYHSGWKKGVRLIKARDTTLGSMHS